MKKSIWTGMAALCLLVGHAQGQVPSREARVQINVAERTLESVVDYLRDRSGANIEVMDTDAEEISTKVIKSLQLSDVHWRTALEIAAEKVGCIVEEREGGVLAVLSPPRITLQMTGEIGEVIDSIAKVSGMNIVVAPQVVGTVSVRFNGVPWRDALEVGTRRTFVKQAVQLLYQQAQEEKRLDDGDLEELGREREAPTSRMEDEIDVF